MKWREGIVTGRFLQLAWFTWFYFSLLLLLINLFFARVASQNLWICLCCSFCCISIWTCSFRGDHPAKPKPQTPLLQLKVNELQISFPYLNPILRQTPVFDWSPTFGCLQNVKNNHNSSHWPGHFVKTTRPPWCHDRLNHFISHLLNIFCSPISTSHPAPNSQHPFHRSHFPVLNQSEVAVFSLLGLLGHLHRWFVALLFPVHWLSSLAFCFSRYIDCPLLLLSLCCLLNKIAPVLQALFYCSSRLPNFLPRLIIYYLIFNQCIYYSNCIARTGIANQARCILNNWFRTKQKQTHFAFTQTSFWKKMTPFNGRDLCNKVFGMMNLLIIQMLRKMYRLIFCTRDLRKGGQLYEEVFWINFEHVSLRCHCSFSPLIAL